ncbi:MAG: head GIN domain-containing protein [Myxococcota bacterium]
MRKALCPVLLALSVAACTSGSGVRGDESRSPGDFDSIDVGGPFRVEVVVGESTAVSVSGDDNVVPKVRTEVDGSRLHVDLPGRVMTDLPLTVTIATPTLVELDAGGASTVTISGVQAENFEVDLSGASQATIRGQSEALEVDVSGASQLHAKDLSAAKVDVEASGASKVSVTATREVDVDASGASTINVHGNPGTVSKDASGASKIHVGS